MVADNKAVRDDVLAYYAMPGRMTSPGPWATALDPLPTEISSLVKVVQGVMLHIFWASQYGVRLTDERKAEVALRRFDRQLARIFELDPRPLVQPRPHEQKLVGNCRDHSVMMAAFLRHRGIPARARCGFGTYFIPGHYEDHWVCEYWNAHQGRWVLVDAQLDDLMVGAMKPDFDPLDVPRDRFIVGGKAWELCRKGAANPDDFGIFDMYGLWFVRGNLIRDFLAFSKVEILPWDGGFGYLSRGGPGMTAADGDYDVMDRIAAMTLADDVDTIRALCASDPGFAIPAEW